MNSHLQIVAAWLAFTSCLLLLQAPHARASTPFQTFAPLHGTKFNHLVIDRDRGWVFIGAVNRLYQLSANLEPIIDHVTGPVDDALECSIRECSPDVVKKPTDNHNKILVIDYLTPRIIACGSVFQGLCSVLSVQNISNVLQVVKQPVAANNPTASTVAFIAPGPARDTISTFVLYVGTTYTGNSVYRSEVPAVASRSLEDDQTLSFAEQGVKIGTYMYISSLYRDRYVVNYVYGFSSGLFSYFLTTQMKSISPNSPYISKLIRICAEDTHYNSYTEIPIECTGSDGHRYNLAQAAFVGKPGSQLAASLGIRHQDDVLFVVFSQSQQMEGQNADKPNLKSALCIYSLTSIQRQFTMNINNCFSGKGTSGLDFINPGRNCVRTKIEGITDDFCGLDVNTPLGGDIPVTAVPVLTFNTRLTAVAATSTGDFTVVFIGTYKGHLKKIVVEDLDHALEYDDLVIDKKSPINPDMLLANAMNYLYVMTDHKVTKVNVQNCSDYDSCWSCLSAKDPYCGWCSLQNKCNLRSDCIDAPRDGLPWIQYKTGQCTSITGIIPKELQRTTVQTLELTINNLPPLIDLFFCAFTIFDKVLVTNATRNDFGLNCPTPTTDLLPSIPLGQHHFTAKLSVKTSNNSDLVDTNVTFFECNTYTSCTSCVSSNFPCDWCVDAHQCTHDTAENCRNGFIITGVNKAGPSYRSGPSFCPTINTTSDGSEEILVAAGTKKSIRARIHLIGTFIAQTRFLCQFNIDGKIISVTANLIADTVYCDQMEFTFSQPKPITNATFAIVWDSSKPLDNPNNIHVLIYKCQHMADNCGMCLALDKKFGCVWCQSTNSCEIKNQCDSGLGGWLNPNDTCPNPSILSFSPQLGPWEGGTNITIQGINLGKSFKDIYSGITVAGISCEPYEHLYKATREIVCLVDGPGTSEYRHGPVQVRVEDFRGLSKTDFEFVDPKIEDIFPRHGPMSGGTMLTIKGKHMNAGSLIAVYIDELPCHFIKANASEIQCLTSAARGLREGKIKVKFDQGVRLYDRHLYEYTEDPTIWSIESGTDVGMNYPKGIPAGGIKILILGTHFLSIQSPRFYLYNEKKTKRYFSSCEVHSDSMMTCPSPYIPTVRNALLNPEKPKQLDYGFVMDNVYNLRNLSFDNNYPKFSLYPNPSFDKFQRTLKDYRSDYLVVNGKNINRACQESDITVYVGNDRCNVTSLSKQQLTCKLPIKEHTSQLQEVVVMIGEHFKEIIGSIEYSTIGAFSTTINESKFFDSTTLSTTGLW